jgi:hypothetical protein
LLWRFATPPSLVMARYIDEESYVASTTSLGGIAMLVSIVGVARLAGWVQLAVLGPVLHICFSMAPALSAARVVVWAYSCTDVLDTRPGVYAVRRQVLGEPPRASLKFFDGSDPVGIDANETTIGELRTKLEGDGLIVQDIFQLGDEDPVNEHDVITSGMQLFALVPTRTQQRVFSHVTPVPCSQGREADRLHTAISDTSLLHQWSIKFILGWLGCKVQCHCHTGKSRFRRGGEAVVLLLVCFTLYMAASCTTAAAESICFLSAKSLDLSSQHLGPVGASWLAPRLQHNGELASLNLANNKLTGQYGGDMTGVTALADALPKWYVSHRCLCPHSSHFLPMSPSPMPAGHCPS